MHKCIQTGTASAFWLVETISVVFWLAPIQLLPVSPESSGLVGVYWVTGGRQNSLEPSFSILLLLLLLLLLQAKVHIIGQLSSKYESNQDCDSLINYGLTKHKKTDSNLSHQHCPAKLQLSSPLSNILHHHITCLLKRSENIKISSSSSLLRPSRHSASWPRYYQLW